MDTEWARDGKTFDSGSVISGLTSLDDDTDEFGRMLVQHVRDEQRLNQALNGPGQAFRKARPHPRIGVTLDQVNGSRNLEIRSLSSGASDPGVAEHTLTYESDPPLNIPRDWGRKGRISNSWLRRLGDMDNDEIERPASANAIQSHQHTETRQVSHAVDWAGVADDPVRSIEQTTPISSRRRRIVSSPGQKEHHNSIERIRQWEADQDFTAGSFLQSTPAVSSRKRELESIQTRGIARDQLSRITERTSPESTRDQLESRMSRLAGQPLHRRQQPSPDDKQWGGSRASLSNKENIPIDGSSRESKERPLTNGTASQAGPVTSKPQRPSTTRQESIQLLKRLARVTSQSPSPSPNAGPQQPASHPRTADEPRTQRQSSAQAPELVNASPSPIHETPRPAPDLPAKTPKVTGAWIDTPLTVRHDSAQPVPSPPTTKDDAPLAPLPPAELSPQHPLPPLKRTASAPALPSSALSHVLRDKPPCLGDDTLASLEDLLDPTLTQPGDVSATLNLDDVRAELDRLHGTGRPLSAADEERREELLVIEGMAGKLRSARRGVREVKRGLRGMEKRVEVVGTAGREDSVGGGEVREGGVWRALVREGLQVFIHGERKLGRGKSWGGLTKVGMVVAAVVTWWVLENAACSIWCHPLYARSMHGFGVDAGAPKFPFVIPTVLLRPFRWLWQPVTSTIVWVLGHIWTGLVAYLGILFEEEPTPRRKGSQIKAPLYRSKRSSMWEESVPVLALREKTKVKEWDDRVADIIQEAAPMQETMDEDKVIREVHQDRKGGGFKLGKLWSWKSSPAESSASMAPSSADSVWGDGETWRSESETINMDSQQMWETGDGMGSDEIL